MSGQISRRTLLGRGAVVGAVAAAAVALPVAAQAVSAPPPTSRGLVAHRDPKIEARLYEIEKELLHTLTDHQRKLWSEYIDLEADQMLAEQDNYITVLAGHFPGLAPAIEIIAGGHHGDLVFGKCCEYWRAV
jgi:hypothetical protein